MNVALELQKRSQASLNSNRFFFPPVSIRPLANFYIAKTDHISAKRPHKTSRRLEMRDTDHPKTSLSIWIHSIWKTCETSIYITVIAHSATALHNEFCLLYGYETMIFVFGSFVLFLIFSELFSVLLSRYSCSICDTEVFSTSPMFATHKLLRGWEQTESRLIIKSRNW